MKIRRVLCAAFAVSMVAREQFTVCRGWRAREPYATRSGKARVTAAVRLETCSRVVDVFQVGAHSSL